MFHHEMIADEPLGGWLYLPHSKVVFKQLTLLFTPGL